MKQAKLKDLFDYLPKSKIKAGDGLESGKYPFYTSSENLSRYLNDFQYEPGCLIFGTGGKANVHLAKSRFSTSTDCITIKPKPTAQIDAQYTFQYFRGNMQVLENGFKGAGLKHISKAYLSDIQIPHPEDFYDQRRIAHLLNKAEGLIAQRKQHLQQLDHLLRSVFLELFGDPIQNEKGWDTDTLTKRCLKITDGTHDTPIRLTNGIPFITGKHIRPWRIDYEGCDFVSEENHKAIYKRCDPKYGDILYTNIGVNLGTAAMNVADFEFSMKNVALLRPSSDLDSRFLEHFLNFEKAKRKILAELASGGAQKFLGLNQIKKIPIVIPPITLQNKFACIVEKVESLKSHYQQNLTDLEALYGELSQQAFKGELDLSRVPLPE